MNAQHANSKSNTELAHQAVELAARILQGSRDSETRAQREQSAMMARMMNDPDGKKFTLAMADQVLRIGPDKRAARRMNQLIQEYGAPRYLGWLDRTVLKAGNRMAGWFPGLIMPQIKSKVRAESKHVIISGEEYEFQKYLERRKRQGLRVNFNQLGEAVLGSHESDRRMRDNIQQLLEPGVEYVSIKLSSIVSQISLTGYRQTVETMKRRLRPIYEAAIAGGEERGPKFVNLDMEEYRDLHLTVDVFQELLDESEFNEFPAGIVLQAYLPDAFEVLRSLTEWAKQRKQRTGTDVKVRIVKGANLAMEQVEAALHGWPQAPYHSKVESDANFKRMLEFACLPDNAAAVRIGVGSHNLFDIAYAILLRDQNGVADRVEFEMLEGMANAQAKEVLQRTGGCLVYAPVVMDAEFESAVAYLVRRLDENTAPGSFLGSLFDLKEGTPIWHEQKDAFLNACQLAHDESLSQKPNRTQNRNNEQRDRQSEVFANEPDTDFSLPANRQWASQILESWKHKSIDPIPIQIGGEFRTDNLTGTGRDPSRPEHETYQYTQAEKPDIESALQSAVEAVSHDQRTPTDQLLQQRSEWLQNAAVIFARQRGETIGAMLLDAGKNIVQADVEVSEAIDFANYYARSLGTPGVDITEPVSSANSWHDGTSVRPIGVVVVTPPWNFPYAIPAGGVLAALAAGNAVILKPARESVLVAWQLVNQLWEAGVPKNQLQFAPTVDGETGKTLVSDPRVSAVVLTGSSETAAMFKTWRPGMKLLAETSGKNAMIITAAADIDLAVKDLVHGAFGHAGQKCSATSLALVERPVYDNPQFMQQLKDAAASLKVAGSWNPSAIVTPVIRPPDEDLMRGLTQLDEGESWLLEPKMIDDNPCLWSPGIRLGVRPNSWYHRTECFGPVLGLIPVDDFEQAVEIQNSSRFGLTGGLHSLDPHEINFWRERVEVGNAYVNRSTTGAIVQRQPFGGWKDSVVGTEAKAGGPNYVAEFCAWEQTGLPQLRSPTTPEMSAVVNRLIDLLGSDQSKEIFPAAAESYQYWWTSYFSQSHDPSQIHGETNEFRYRVRPWFVLRLEQPDSAESKTLACLNALACHTVGIKWELSVSESSEVVDAIGAAVGVQSRTETDGQLARRLSTRRGGALRIIGDYDPQSYASSVIGNTRISKPQVFLNGRLELLNYFREQSVSETVHRYGNII